MDKMINANIALDILGIILSMIPVIYLVSNHQYRQKLNLLFLCVALSNIFMIIGDLADWIIQDASQPSAKIILSVFTAVFYIFSAFVLYFFALYMGEYLHLSDRAHKLFLTLITSVCSIQIFFAFISPFTGAVFYVTDEGYQRGSLFLISQIVPLFCYITFTVLVIIYRSRLSRREIIFFLLYIFVPLGGGAIQMFIRGIAVVNICVSLALLFIMVNIQFRHEIQLKRQEKELAELRIDIMLSQIQPHFLYNVLTVIRKLCETNPQQAVVSISTFSKFLRTNMESLTDKNPIPFEKELAHTKAYLDLEHQRFGDKLNVVYEINSVNFFLPPLTLQPIVENAVRHGLMKKENGGTVKISSTENDNAFYITVTDNGVGFSHDSYKRDINTHIGIENVRNRLKTLCNGTVKIQSQPGQGTIAMIEIPKWR